MKSKLIKLSDTHYIIVDDSEIKEGDFWIYICLINGLDCGDNNNPVVKNNLPKEWFEKLHDRKNYKKITHSTQPYKGMENVTFISLSEVEEAICKCIQELIKDEFIQSKEQVEDGLFNILNKIQSECYITPTKDFIVREAIRFLPPKTELDIEFDEQGKLKIKS